MFYLYYFWCGNIFRLQNYETPETKNYRNYIIDYVNDNLYIRKTVTLMDVELTSDDSFWYFGNTQTKKYLQKDNTQSYTEYHAKNLEDFEKDPKLI